MKTISKTVEDLLFKEPFLIEMLITDLVNISSLARKLKPEIEKIQQKEIQIGSIVMALNRLVPILENDYKKIEKKNLHAFNDINVRTNLSDYTYENSKTLIKCQQELLSSISNHPEVFCTVTRGVFETTVIISNNHVLVLESIFRGERLVSRINNLASLTVGLPKNNTTSIGLYYLIFKNIAWQGINIYEVISTTNEITVLSKDTDINKIFAVLSNNRF